ERIVLVCLRHAESGHHGITGELLDDATVLDDAARDRLEEPRDTATHDLRVGARDEPSRVDDVDEQHRCELSLHVRIVETMAGAASIPGRATSIPSVLDPSVFKAYDVRGIYPSQLDEDGAYRVARAYTA